MKSVLTNRLNYLRTRLHDDFGDTDAQTVWLDAGGGTWMKIPVMQTRARPQRREMTGLLTMEVGDVVLFAKKSEWPAVKPDDIFLLGPPDAGDAEVPDATNLKYRVTACPASPQLDWQRIEAQAH